MGSEAEFFDSIAEEWDGWECPDIQVRLARVLEYAKISAEMRVLDVGTGTGVFLRLLSGAVGESGSVLGIDISAGMLAVARRKGLPPNVRLELVPFGEIEGNADYDRVMINAVFPHLGDSSAALNRATRLLRAGGLVVISHPIGREAVNRLHGGSSEVVAEDRVPLAEEFHRLFARAGLVDAAVVDEPEFHLAIARKG